MFPNPAILVFLICLRNVHADTEFCVKTHNEMFSLNKSHCPFGILLPHPVLVDCFSTTETAAEVSSDICSGSPIDNAPNKKSVQIQYISELNGEPEDEESPNSCKNSEKCGSSIMVPSTWITSVRKPTLPVKEIPWPTNNGSSTQDVDLFNQTQRMFKYLIGLSPPDDDDGLQSLRLVTLLKKSFMIVKRFCGSGATGTTFVPHDFTTDVEAAFLFLLGEAVNHPKIKDVSISDFKKINHALNTCLNQPKPFSFIGTPCKRSPKIDSINYTSTGDLIPYKRNPEFSWSPEKYDIPIDVTWTVLDFAHGICYGMFRNYTNYHHLFLRAIERLFVPEIINRWDKPVLLARQNMWDHFFSANVRTVIRNLEHCTEAAYHNSPFLHRLERILVKFNAENSTAAPDAPKSRKRRAAHSHAAFNEATDPLSPVKDLELFCFSTAEDRDQTVQEFKSNTCET